MCWRIIKIYFFLWTYKFLDILNFKKSINKQKAKQQKKNKPLFRIFFPIIKNQKYPFKESDSLAHLFVDRPLPNPFELDILNQKN